MVLAERDCITQFVERHLRCGCGKRLRFSKAGSQQVRPWLSCDLPPPSPRALRNQAGACASLRFVCENSCAFPLLHTSSPMHGDDYLLNSKLHYGLVTCAIPYTRAASLLALLGMCAPSETDHYAFKVRVRVTLTLTLTLTLTSPLP